MKKVTALLSFIMIFALLCGCQRYSGVKPCDYEDAKWVCEDPFAYFVVDSSSKEPSSPIGKNNFRRTGADVRIFLCRRNEHNFY